VVTSVCFVLYFLDMRKLSSQYVLIDGLICPWIELLVCWYALILLSRCTSHGIRLMVFIAVIIAHCTLGRCHHIVLIFVLFVVIIHLKDGRCMVTLGGVRSMPFWVELSAWASPECFIHC